MHICVVAKLSHFNCQQEAESLAVRTSSKITGEDTPLTEPTSPPNETHSHKYLRQESDVSERNYRPDSSLRKIAIQKKLVRISMIHIRNLI